MKKIKHGSFHKLKELIRSGEIHPQFNNIDIEITGVLFMITEVITDIPDMCPTEITLGLYLGQLKNEEDFFRKICQVTHFLKEDKDVKDFIVSSSIEGDRWYKDRIIQLECNIILKI